jgi:hypothetical protein
VRGDSQAGGKLGFYFGYPAPAAVMEVTELVPDRRVVWRCEKGPDEGVGTTLTYDVTTTGETSLLFTHAYWRDPMEFMDHCSTKWAYHLLGLEGGLEGGTATPYPEDMKISSWG